MLGKLKPGWTRVRFGEVVRLNKDRVADPLAAGIERYVGIEHIEPENLRIRKWGLVAEGTTFTNYFKPGQVLFVKRRAYQRKVAVADFEGVCSGDIYVLESKDPEVFLPELLPFICQTDAFFEHAVRTSAGSLSPRTNWKQLADYEFALPPLAEQRRIAEVLLATNTVINNYQTLVGSIDRLWLSISYREFNQAYSEKTVRLGKYLSYGSDGPFGSKLKTVHYSDSGVRVIRLQNIDINEFNDSDKAFIPLDYYRSTLTNYTVRAGDVLVAGLGDDNIQPGRACIAPDYLGPAINKADCYCLRPNSPLDARFLVAFFNSPQGLRQSKSYAQGTTRYRLNLGNIKRMKIPLPRIETQHKIVEKLDSIFESKKWAEQRYSEQMRLMKTIINTLLGAT